MKAIRLVLLCFIAILCCSLISCGGSSDEVGSTKTQSPTDVKAKSVTITPIGLGESILVTNTSPITITGVAESDIEIDRVEYFNQTTNIKGIAEGKNSWTATMALTQGDNKIVFSAYTNDETKAEISTVITYYQNTDFTTSLNISIGTLYVNESKDVTFTIGIGDGANATVTLYSTDKSGELQTVAGLMKDDGILPDEIQSDGLFTTKLMLNPSQTGYICYRVEVDKTDSMPYYSENKCIWVTTHFSNENISKSVTLADTVKSIYEQEASIQDAAQAAVAQLGTDPSVGAVNNTDEGGVWWITKSGILGLYHPTLTGQKSGAGDRDGSAQASKIPSLKPRFEVSYYPFEYLSDRSRYIPSYLNKKVYRKVGSGYKAKSSSKKNEIKSIKGLFIGPYINNPDDVKDSFGQGDDYYVPWKTLKDENACILQATKEVLNNGSININLDTFKNLEDYGYIHISSHGDNFYKELLSIWQDIWGPNYFLWGSLSQVVIYTGIVLSKNADGTYNKTYYEDDLKEKRIAISADGSIVILPSFIKDYTCRLPNSLVVLSLCRSMYNNSMANAFLAKGAGAVVGYSDYVSTSYTQNTLDTIINELFAGKNIKEAVDEAISTYGSNDGDSTPAYLRFAGSDDLALGGGLQNGGFEDGVLTPWVKTGDGRIITQLGDTSPTEGAYMGIISTGLGYTIVTGEIQQDFCSSTNSKQLSFNWNFFSEEFQEWCDSKYQDTFKVSICEIDNSTKTESCDIVFDATIDYLCNVVSPASVYFDISGPECVPGNEYDSFTDCKVWNTGWQTETIDFTPYAGKHIRLKFYATDIGDSIFDSAILIDKIEITEE